MLFWPQSRRADSCTTEVGFKDLVMELRRHLEERKSLGGGVFSWLVFDSAALFGVALASQRFSDKRLKPARSEQQVAAIAKK